MIKRMHRLLGNDKGLAALEFALLLPLLIVLTLATAEITRYAIIHQKLNATTRGVADLVTRSSSVSIASLNSYASAVEKLMEPYGFDGGTVIFSSVASVPPGGGSGADFDGPGGIPGSRCIHGCITWRHTVGSATSIIGRVGRKATLPNGYELSGMQNVIVVELVYNYVSLLPISQNFIGGLLPTAVRSIIVQMPRNRDKMITPPR